MDYPLVSCLMPTYNRREFIPRAIQCFLSQDYPNLELIILEDGPDSIKDLLPDDPRIKYTHSPADKHNHGTKMNICMEQARGEYAIVFDDDDWYMSNRVSRQIVPMIGNPDLAVTGTSTLYYYKHGENKAYCYISPKAVGWLASIAIRKAEWERHRFDAIGAGADFNFQRKVPPAARLDLCDPNLVVASIHGTNASRKSLGSEYKPVPWQIIEQLWQKSNVLAAG